MGSKTVKRRMQNAGKKANRGQRKSPIRKVYKSLNGGRAPRMATAR